MLSKPFFKQLFIVKLQLNFILILILILSEGLIVK